MKPCCPSHVCIPSTQHPQLGKGLQEKTRGWSSSGHHEKSNFIGTKAWMSVLFPAGEAAGDVPSLCVSFSYFDPKFHQWMQCAAWCAIPLAFANGSCLSTDKFVLNIKILTNWHIPIREQKTHWYLSKHWDGGSHNDATNWCLHTFKWQWKDELFFF